MFLYDQPLKTRDCGYRCLYYIIKPGIPYVTWLEEFRHFDPVHSGIFFYDICTVLKYYKIPFKFTQLTEKGLYIVFSGEWLGKKHQGGHYFVYEDGVIHCSRQSGPLKMSLAEVIEKMETKSPDRAFRVLKIIK